MLVLRSQLVPSTRNITSFNLELKSQDFSLLRTLFVLILALVLVLVLASVMVLVLVLILCLPLVQNALQSDATCFIYYLHISFLQLHQVSQNEFQHFIFIINWYFRISFTFKISFICNKRYELHFRVKITRLQCIKNTLSLDLRLSLDLSLCFAFPFGAECVIKWCSSFYLLSAHQLLAITSGLSKWILTFLIGNIFL